VTRQPYAHDAVVAMGPDEDDGAPGATVTIALCGSWEHEGPCLLAPHHTRAVRDGNEVRLRILFAAEPGDEELVRRTIDGALARGVGDVPGSSPASWRLVSGSASEVRSEELEHAVRLTRN
jgi:hypothetical protein